jgi:hypothetical protein
VITDGLDDIWTLDHAGPWKNALDNDGFAYLLVVEDCFSRFCWVVAQKDLSSKTTWDAFDMILQESKRAPNKLWCDEGVAFKGVFAKNCKAKGIEIYHTYGQNKAAMAERLIRTIGEALYRKLTENNTKRWIDLLPEVVREYNSNKHSVTGMSPTQASNLDSKGSRALFSKLYNDSLVYTPAVPKLEVGDWVRISRQKEAFEKGRTENWTTELYKVVKVFHTKPVTYRIADNVGDPIQGSFYEAELQKSTFDPKTQQELLAPRRKAGPDEVERVISYRISPTDKSRFGKYILLLEFGDGGREERPLSDFVGKEIKGKFQATQRNPDQVLRPIDEYLKNELPDVLALI